MEDKCDSLIPVCTAGGWYWVHLGNHVAPQSLYLQQMEERLGAQAVQNLERSPVGGGSLDVPTP